jgi:hypothetical protein
MNGVLVMLALLRAHQPLIALVQPAQIMAGTVPQGSALPAIGVTEVSRNEFPTVSRDEPTTLVRARIQVTVHAKDYPSQKQLVLAAKLGMGVHAGPLAGVKVRTVLRLDVGPDFSDDDAGIYQQSRDFMVTYIEPN